MKTQNGRFCLECGEPLSGRQRKWCCGSCQKRNWCRNNPERHREYYRNYMENNRERFRKYMREYQRRNGYEYQKKRHAQEMAFWNSLSDEEQLDNMWVFVKQLLKDDEV